MTAAKLELPEGVKHGRHAYNKYRCRCMTCREANTVYCRTHGKVRRNRAVYLLRCDDCPVTTPLDAIALHAHTMAVHGRRINDQERTPRT